MTIQYETDDEIRAKLMSMGLDIEALGAAMKSSFAAFNTCGNLDAPSFKGTLGWNTALVVLRERLQQSRVWEINNIQNFCLTENPKTGISIAVISGNKHTGKVRLPSGIQPNTRGKLGLFREASATKNSCQMELFSDEMLEAFGEPEIIEKMKKLDHEVWFFLINNYDDRPYAELSLPYLDSDGNVLKWKERIILPNPDGSGLEEQQPTIPDSNDDFGIEVTFKKNV